MAQYFYDVADETTGVKLPSFIREAINTASYNTEIFTGTRPGGATGNIWRVFPPSTGTVSLILNEVGKISVDRELVFIMKGENLGGQFLIMRPGVRIEESDEANAQWYAVGERPASAELQVRQTQGAGVPSSLAAVSSEVNSTNWFANWYVVRSKMTAAGLVQSRISQFGSTEPSTWQLEYTVSINSWVDSFCGVVGYNDGRVLIAAIGVGTNGDPAPSTPVTGGVTLSVDSISLSMALESPTLTQANQLAVDDLQLQTSLDAVSLQQANVLSPDGLSLSSFLDEVTLSSAGQLNVNSLQLNTGLESVELQQANLLSVDSLQLSTLLETADLQQANQLVVEGLLLTTTFESPDLSVGLTLVPDSIWLSALLDQVSLTQSHLLTVDDLTQSISLDNVTLTVAGQVIGSGTLTIGITGPSISIGISP